MKIPIQTKIAELEARIEKLERARQPQTFTQTTTVHHMDLEPELSGIWTAFDGVFERMNLLFKKLR